MSTAECLSTFQRLQRALNKRKTKIVGAAEDRNLARATAEAWVRNYRASIVEVMGVSKAVQRIDRSMQEVLKLSFGMAPRNAYKATVREATSAVRDLAVQVTVAEWSGRRVREDTADTEIVRRLDRLNPAVADGYRQVLADVEDVRRTAWKGTANELREVLREVLDALAPDAEVRKKDWFKQTRASARSEEDRRRGPTQIEKVRYILEERARAESEVATAQEAVREIEGKLEHVVRAVYTRASTATHVEREREEIRAVLRYMRAVLHELLPAQ